ncbi:MAG: zinc-ribbon domain-containing protein [Deltaproteobacteria bacterium]|uniref:Zinc-ribbon domain-containing protein n=1 Tax=Candidatus Zymogenus saltonus TaxID=2844893 RepID=A0A9D8KDV1_9DELT|nr:zinc-ribbon domain-containing protein [Candidatus Zymogenus saltonus]
MEIHCPKCDFRGNINEEKIPESGKYLNCPKCKHRFLIKRPKPGMETVTATVVSALPPISSQVVKDPVKIEVLDSALGRGCKIEILQYEKIEGSKDIETAEALYYANKSGIKLKQVKITLDNGEAVVEAGALQYMKGDVEMESKLEGRKALKSKFLAKETAYKPRYSGTGEIFLEPSFGHYVIYRLKNESLVVNKGMFYCCEGAVDVDVVRLKNISAVLFGGEGLFQTKLTGTGIAALESPVPLSEIKRIDLMDQKLSIDGNFALMWTDSVDFTVQRSTKSLIGSIAGGEGLLQTFRGTGRVWIAPTESIYRWMKTQSAISQVAPRKRGLNIEF